MIQEQLIAELFRLQDAEYRALQLRLIPTVQPETVIGVRTPTLRRLARQLARSGDASAFLEALPHRYFEENQLHAFMISEMRDLPACLEALDRFLPYVDNWATCDQMSPGIFKRHRTELLESIRKWLRSNRTYTIRFALGMLMAHYLDEDFDPAYPELAASVRSEEYYVKMMIAWYFATALAKQYDAALPFLVDQRLDPWTHNKTIQKAVESYRITPEQKAYLKTLKRKA